MEETIHTIDATGKSMGKIAVQAALILRGKEKPGYVPYKNMGDAVLIKNVSKMRITGKKLEQKKYYRHSGYPGGLREITLKALLVKNPSEALKKAVYGMLPPNKLRRIQIQKLRFE